MATGVTVALDDDASAPVDRPVVTPVTTSEGTLDIQAILAKVQPSVVAVEDERHHAGRAPSKAPAPASS